MLIHLQNINTLITKQLTDLSQTRALLKKGSKTIAPLWSLENFVAVNPYLGMSRMDFDSAMEFLNKSAGAHATLPVEFYKEALERGILKKEDLEKALSESDFIDETADAFIQVIYETDATEQHFRVQTFADVASEINGKKWRRFMIDRISLWASAYFDEKQAVWNTTGKSDSLYTAWRKEAAIDYSTEAMGLKGFRKLVKYLPEDYLEAASIALERLDIPENILDHYLSSLLFKVNGWAGFTARLDWDASLRGEETNHLQEFLTILLVWEMCLREVLPYNNLDEQWRRTKSEMQGLIATEAVDTSFSRKLILQKAYDIANQRTIINRINTSEPERNSESKAEVQAVFCIDVRSEVIRRNLEAAHQNIETFGFAGFFGFPIKFKSLAHDEGTDQCPVLLPTAYTIHERMDDEKKFTNAVTNRKLHAHLNKAWKTFKSGAISCFSFVSPLGLYFLPKLITDSFGWTRPVTRPEKAGLTKDQIQKKKVELEYIEVGDYISGIPMEDRINMAASALKGMTLTDNFAPIVMLVGHGASTTNNPHATGLDCGACGGHTGEANVKVAASILNDKQVRSALSERGIGIPNSTIFLAALHDTTTDKITIFNREETTEWHQEYMQRIDSAIEIAGSASRKERALRMNLTGANAESKLLYRSKDWSQVRPEWGLAGCSSFIVAPRKRTSTLDLGGKSFMHSYDWKKDDGFGVLELIMTAPMVVTSWINLQYYASTVDNKRFGAGNKTLHNVVGGLGVLEGFAGDLRVGLPWQSVHDGEKFQHEPQRLNVIIEAPVDEMSKILEKHDSIMQLVDNQWIYLFAMNDDGKVAYKYIGDLQWEVIN